MSVIIERKNKSISLNFCFLLIEVSETEKTIIAITPNNMILKINKKTLSL